ncbi:tRNA-splicing endonuclease subunit Sen2-2 [Acorus calamus]|uniref:tRNA-splicing endonuclease subunit Sen2-2 n=1 Tax=Acorus calamus TaxID=4465 RepID=A0AAV9CYZ8_ACOCL|nr:tRNA-splicing endonuclease subunit Sen2-2 [Acorus calamus]
MWKQKFPVRVDSEVERRREVEEWAITLAFSHAQTLDRSPGVYAFLPTEMVTGFPFIIQADFILASSRETILLDNKWNQGILSCVASAFVSAFESMLKTSESAPDFALPPYFKFLPVKSSAYPELESVQMAIREKVVAENFIPCQSYTNQRIFCKPGEVRRLMPAFWAVLSDARKEGVGLEDLSSHGTYILSSAFDASEYDDVLNFLGVKYVDDDWYAKCVAGSNLVMGVSEDLYMRILYFFAENWSDRFNSTSARSLPLLKYVDRNGKVSLISAERAMQGYEKVRMSYSAVNVSWVINWNHEFRCCAGYYFVPRDTQSALTRFSKSTSLMEWLRQYMSVTTISLYSYADLCAKSLDNENSVIGFAHFLYHSHAKKCMTDEDVRALCRSMPLVDNYGGVVRNWSSALVPAKGSQWIGLLGSDPWRGQGFVELSGNYGSTGTYAMVYTPENHLLSFMRTHVGASDIPHISPPNAAFPTVASPLTRENALLLLEWIHNLRDRGTRMPEGFKTCIRDGCWVKTSAGYRSPSDSFLPSSDWGSLLQMGSLLVDIPLIDLEFYGERIEGYKEELKAIGVMFEFGEACRFIGKHFMSLASTHNLTRGKVFSMLKFMKFLRKKYLPTEEFVKSVMSGRWLRTIAGTSTPAGSILRDSEWAAASIISHLPFVDVEHYGDEILGYKTELQLLGVVVGFNRSYQLVIDNFEWPAYMSSFTVDCAYLIFECVRNARLSDGILSEIKRLRWLKTNGGLRSPSECFLFDPDWKSLLRVIDAVPLIDESFYGTQIHSYEDELKKIGVVVTFADASSAVSRRFETLASEKSLTKEHVLSLLAFYRQIKEAQKHFPAVLMQKAQIHKWVKTKLGYNTLGDSILFDEEWKPVSQIACLPFIDRDHYGEGINEYKDELKAFGVTVEFQTGSRFVFKDLCIPSYSAGIAPDSVIALLNCIRIFKSGVVGVPSFPKDFTSNISKTWLKTVAGYKSPKECILFGPSWETHLEREDGPFIDEEFYGPCIKTYEAELAMLGDAKLSNWVWIPSGDEDGKWVSSSDCVLHDNDDLYSGCLHVLDKIYEKDLLSFFSTTLGVRQSPSVADYVDLWKGWENSKTELAHDECCAFWICIARNWNKKTEQLLVQNIRKLPVISTASGGIVLSDKDDVFIPDDLQLKDDFDKENLGSMFVWYPQPSLASVTRAKLYQIYASVGVRTISESVKIEQPFISKGGDDAKNVNKKYATVRNGVSRIVLAFLADPSLELSAEKRHQTVKWILDLKFLETEDPVKVRYSVSMSGGKDATTVASRIFRWERERSELYVQKIDKMSTKKEMIEFATYFSQVMSEGLMWDETDRIGGLSELIKIGCLLKFEKDAVDFLLMTKNLRVLVEDEQFLSLESPLHLAAHGPATAAASVSISLRWGIRTFSPQSMADLLNRVCLGRPIVTAEKDKLWFELGLEEALYLHHHMKCLPIVCENENPMNDEELWACMNSVTKRFLVLYKAYSHLCSKRGDARLESWPDLQCALRVCGSVAKTLLVLDVDSKGCVAEEERFPACLEEYTAEECVIKRWTPEKCRESSQTVGTNGN